MGMDMILEGMGIRVKSLGKLVLNPTPSHETRQHRSKLREGKKRLFQSCGCKHFPKYVCETQNVLKCLWLRSRLLVLGCPSSFHGHKSEMTKPMLQPQPQTTDHIDLLGRSQPRIGKREKRPMSHLRLGEGWTCGNGSFSLLE